MNILEFKNIINFEAVDAMSKFLVAKNGISYQSYINTEENNELIIEILSNSSKNKISSEIADVFITLVHVFNSFNIKDQVEKQVTLFQKKQIDDIKLCVYLARLSKEITKTLNREANNIDEIIKHAALVMVGLYKYMLKHQVINLVNKHILQKVNRTIKRCNISDNFPDHKKKNWDEIFLIMAYAMASGSHCVSRQVGALLVKNKRIISTGINGTPEGCNNCDELFPPKTSPLFNRADHHKFSTKNEIHAEMNAILFQAKKGGGYNLDEDGGTTLYCTLQPCDECLKNVLQSGISRIVYAESYDFSEYSEFILKAIKEKEIELVHMPLKNTAMVYTFIQDAMVKTKK